MRKTFGDTFFGMLMLAIGYFGHSATNNIPPPAPAPAHVPAEHTAPPANPPLPALRPITLPAVDHDAQAKALLAAHNAARQQAGLRPLRLDAALCVSAQSHASHMASVRMDAHDGIGDGDPWGRMRVAGYFYSVAAENDTSGEPNAGEATMKWLGDARHRANLLGNYADVGFGAARDLAGVWYWCADYGSPQK